MAQYNENVVLKELANCIGNYVDAASKQLKYTKGFKGTVIEVLGHDFYYLRIDGVKRKIKTDMPLQVNDVVNLIELQNANEQYCVIPSKEMIKRIIQEGNE